MFIRYNNISGRRMEINGKFGDLSQIKIISLIMTLLLSAYLFFTLKEYIQFLHNEEYLLMIPTFLYMSFFLFIFFYTSPQRLRLVLTATNLILITTVALVSYLAYLYLAIIFDLIENRWLCPTSVPCLNSSTLIAIYIIVLLIMSGPIAFLRFKSKNYYLRRLEA
jgi:hypothetical protein